MASNELESLASIISSSVQAISSAYAKTGRSYPSLDDYDAPPPLNDPDVVNASMLAISAAGQLMAILRPTPLTVLETTSGMYGAAALGVVTEANVVEILRSAGPQGLHVREIGEKTGISPDKLARILRNLASTKHIFKEVSPNVFANNRLSIILDKGKTLEEIKAHPEDKYEESNGLAAFVRHTTDEGGKSAAHIIDHVLDPATTFSDEPNVTPFSRAHKLNTTVWSWFEEPGNEARLKRFAAAMRSANNMVPPELITSLYDWNSLEEGSVVVDVGGGIGSSTLILSKAFPKLRYVVQDREAVVPVGKKRWESEYPEALESGLVKFQAHDFFEPQPVKDASVFFLRFIIHDWAEAESKTILSHLRAVALPKTKLFLLETIVPYACPTDDEFAHIPGADIPAAPSPLLANFGAAHSFVYNIDMQMMSLLSALERTVPQWVELGKSTGWALKSIHRGPQNLLVYETA